MSIARRVHEIAIAVLFSAVVLTPLWAASETLPATAADSSAEAAPAPSASNPDAQIDEFNERKQRLRQAEFDLSFLRWSRLPEADRAAIRASLGSDAEAREDADRRRVGIDSKRAESLSDEHRRTQRSAEVQSKLLEDLDRHQNRELDALYEADTALQSDRAVLDLLRTDRKAAEQIDGLHVRNFLEYRARVTEFERRVDERMAALDGRALEISDRYEARRRKMQESVSSLEAERVDLGKRRSEALGTRGRSETIARRRAARNRARIWRIDRLDRALDEGYVPALDAAELGTWAGSEILKTGEFKITAPLWAVELDTPGSAGGHDVTVDVHSAEDRRLVSRITNRSLPHESFAVFDTPGEFYIEVKTRESASYRVRALEFR